MERPNRPPRNQDKWRRIIQPAGDSDSSDWSSDSDFGLLVNRCRSSKQMAGHPSSSSTNERPASPVNVNDEDVAQDNEDSNSPTLLHPKAVNLSHQRNFFKIGSQNRVAEYRDVKPLGNADVSNPLLHHNYAERNHNEQFDTPSDRFWLFARKKLPFLSDRPYYLGASSDVDCGLPALPSSSSSVTDVNSASTSNMSDCWAQYTVNLKRRTPPPPPPPIRKRIFAGYTAGDTSGNQSMLTGSTSIQDNMPSTSSDVQLQYPPIKDLCVDWLSSKKSSAHGYKRLRFCHDDSQPQPVEDSSEVQIVSVLDGPSSSSTPARSSGYCSAPPPVKRVRWCLRDDPHASIEHLYETPTVARNDDDSANNVEVINLEESTAETSSGSRKPEVETAHANSDDTSERCKEEVQQPGPSTAKMDKEEKEQKPDPSFASGAAKRNEEEQLNQGIIGLLECPVCMDYMGPPINQCRRGHLICSYCKPKLANCPTCRSRFSEQRNLAMEKVAEKLHYPCKNVHMGCAHTLRLRDREEHESNCEHRSYRCAIVPPCDWRGQHQEILPHMTIAHTECMLFGAEHELEMVMGDFSEQTSENWLVSAFGELFRVNLGAVRGGRVQVFGCVIFIGPACRASLFNYTLTVGPNPEDCAQRSLTFSRATHCYVDRCSVYYSAGDCFHLRNESAQLFCVGPCNVLKVKLKIERMVQHQ